MLQKIRTVKGVSKARVSAGRLLLGSLFLATQCRADAGAEEFGRTHDSLLAEPIGLDRLHSIGIRPYSVSIGEFVANIEGGNRTGSVWQGLIDFGVDIEFDESTNWRGTSLHLGAFAIFGDDPSEHLVGDFNALSNIAAFNTVRLFQAWLQKEWRDGAIAMRIGQIGADDDFMVSENAGLFVNSAFGPLPTESANIGAPIFPLGAPGLWGSFRITENANFQFGIYSGDAGEEEVNDDGLEFGLGGDRGYVLFLEAGSEIEINGMPGVYKIGGFYHTGDFENFGSGLMVEGNSSLYFVGDQALFSESDPNQGLGSFFRIGFSPREERNTVKFYSDFGFTYSGLLPGRNSDLFGIAFSITRFGDEFLDSISGASGPAGKTERILEITYQIPVSPWMTLQPDLQVIFDPLDGESDAVAIGLRFQAAF